MEESAKPIEEDPSIRRLESFAEILDNRFRIPGTKIRFGIDAIIGLIPYAGDVFTFVISGYLLSLIARKGAGGKILLKMIWNIWIDGVVGTVPFLGDIFDFRYRANTRNVGLMKEYLREGKHGGSAWGIILLLLLVLLILIGLSVWVMRAAVIWIFS